MSDQIVNAYILAGGKSSRMGTDKGLMLLRGKPVIQYIIEKLEPVVDHIFIVSNNRDYEQFNLVRVSDRIMDIGPAGGIYSALSHSKVAMNFIISCDMPFITSGAIEFIIQNSLDSQITLPMHSGKTEPLLGVYKTDCLAVWEQHILNGQLKLQILITHFDLLTLNTDDNGLFNESVFTNINTREDLEKLE